MVQIREERIAVRIRSVQLLSFLTIASVSCHTMSGADSDSDVIALTPQQSVAVDEFCAFTGSTPEAAKQALEACNWNLEMAVTMQIDYGEPVDPVILPNSSSLPSTSSHRSDEDSIRAPIPPVRQVLVDDFSDMEVPIYGHRTRSQIPIFSNTLRDFQREARKWIQSSSCRNSSPTRAEYREGLANQASGSGAGGGEAESDLAKRRTLEDLFRPPLDLMFQGSFENAKDKGVRDNRWLMINIQDESEFSCQVLNRDIWSNAAVKSIIEEHFVFWQVYKNSREGLRYMQFYPVNQFPYVAILDPRTGEKLKCWSVINDSNMFCELVTDFLQDHPTPSGEPIAESLPLPAAAPPALISNDKIVEMSEEEQLKAAIAASLQEPIKICDDDEEIETFSCDDDESPIEIENHVNSNSSDEKISDEKQTTKDSETTTASGDEDYTTYLGQEKEMADLVLRLPNGQREKLTVPSDSKLKAIFLLVQSKGFSLSQYDIVAYYPRRVIHDMSPNASLSSLGLLKEQLYIQLKH